jgi:hypothetical protein
MIMTPVPRDRFDVATLVLRYWWVVVGLWIVGTIWLFGTLHHAGR